ncbi:MAG: LysR family transcriptional regulator [bacterium]|nr:LysR family transcriptional regulator [bacterium]
MTLQQLRYAIAIADNHSMNKAAGELFISQPSLSGAIKELEEEINLTIFTRSNRGIKTTVEGEEFLGYARQIIGNYELLEDRFVNKASGKKKFAVSMQHYTFAVQAFIQMVKHFGMNEYEFAVRETKTYEIIQDVKHLKSELGILYLNDFNEKALTKIFHENELEFVELMNCRIYAYIWKKHPLAGKKSVSFTDLMEYPCLSFEQGNNNAFYFAEEVFSTLDYKQIIKANDRATVLNLMVGLNGYTLCSGIICEDLNGDDYTAVPLENKDTMRIGYIKRKNVMLSELAKIYIKELEKFKDSVL